MRPYFVLVLIAPFLVACEQSPPAPESSADAAPAVSQPAAEPSASEPQADTAAADVAPIIGRWSYDGMACTGPIEITATSFQGAENACTFDSLTVGEDGTITASMSCSSQGETSKEQLAMTPIFGPAGEGIRLNYIDRGGDPVNVFRCAR